MRIPTRELYRQSGVEYYRNAGLAIFENAWYHRNKALKDPYSILGFYSDWTGLVYTAISIGRTLNDDKFVNRGLRLINELFQFDITKFSVDVTYGIAGAIPALIKINKHYPSHNIENLFTNKVINYSIRLSAMTRDGHGKQCPVF